MLSRFNGKNIKRGINYLKRNGLSSAYYKAIERLVRDDDEADYTKKVIEAELSDEQIAAQKNTSFEKNYLISILVPAYNPDEESFVKLLDSVVNQTYSNWELIIADAGDSPRTKEIVDEYLETVSSDDNSNPGSCWGNIPKIGGNKIIYKHLDKNLGISGNTNEALSLANGEYTALLDHDDELTLDALYEVMCAINGKSSYVTGRSIFDKEVKFIYSDEDKVDYDNTHYFDWHQKYDFDPVMLLTNNYICHLAVIETSLARKVGGFDPEMDGSQDYDFFLKCVDAIDEEEIIHITKVLYHWRSSKASTAENPQAKLYAYEAGKRAVEAHLKRIGIDAKAENTEHLGFFCIDFPVNDVSLVTLSPGEFDSLNKDSFDDISQEYIMVIAEDLKARKGYLDKLMAVMILPKVGAATGKIVRSGKIESAGYNIDKTGERLPCFAGMNRHFSGYLHRASILRCVDDYDKGCVLLKKDALVWNGDGPVLKEGSKCVYVPDAVFTRAK